MHQGAYINSVYYIKIMLNVIILNSVFFIFVVDITKFKEIVVEQKSKWYSLKCIIYTRSEN